MRKIILLEEFLFEEKVKDEISDFLFRKLDFPPDPAKKVSFLLRNHLNLEF